MKSWNFISGWQKNKLRVRVGLMVLLMNSSLVFSNEQQEKNNDESAEIEFLEFLGSWEDENGDWLDPMTLISESEKSGEAQSDD